MTEKRPDPNPLYPPQAMRDGKLLTPEQLYELRLAATNELSRKLISGVGLRAPWSAVDRIIGMPFLPGWLVLVGARAKGGKSTFLRALFQGWVKLQKRVLYVGTEQDAAMLGLLVAAESMGVPARLALDPGSPEHRLCMDHVANAQRASSAYGVIVAEPDLSVAGFTRWCRVAQVGSFDAVLLDHFHRIAAPVGERTAQRSEDVRTIKTLAEKGDFVIVAAAQLRNAEGPLGEYEVPGVASWAETSNLRRECDVALQAWRPLKRGVTNRDRMLAKEQPDYLARLVQRNTMAVRRDAHRYAEDEEVGCRLSVINGALVGYQSDGSDILRPTPNDLSPYGPLS
jgi:hypothetical protein